MLRRLCSYKRVQLETGANYFLKQDAPAQSRVRSHVGDPAKLQPVLLSLSVLNREP